MASYFKKSKEDQSWNINELRALGFRGHLDKTAVTNEIIKQTGWPDDKAEVIVTYNTDSDEIRTLVTVRRIAD